MSKVLAIETSTLAGSVALTDRAGLIGACRLAPGARHSEQLLVAIDRVLKESGTLLPELDAIAVSMGPGSFTGLRIGLATAKGLAMGADKPIVPVPTMEVIAAAFPQTKGLTMPMIDARQEEVYWSLFDYREGDLIRCKPDQLGSPHEALEEIKRRLPGIKGSPPDEVLFAGDGAVKYRENIAGIFGARARFPSQTVFFPSAEQLAQRALLRLEKGEVCRPDQAVPLYLRISQAELKWEAGRGRIRSG